MLSVLAAMCMAMVGAIALPQGQPAPMVQVDAPPEWSGVRGAGVPPRLFVAGPQSPAMVMFVRPMDASGAAMIGHAALMTFSNVVTRSGALPPLQSVMAGEIVLGGFLKNSNAFAVEVTIWSAEGLRTIWIDAGDGLYVGEAQASFRSGDTTYYAGCRCVCTYGGTTRFIPVRCPTPPPQGQKCDCAPLNGQPCQWDGSGQFWGITSGCVPALVQ